MICYFHIFSSELTDSDTLSITSVSCFNSTFKENRGTVGTYYGNEICLFGFAPYGSMTLDSIISYMSIMFVVLYASQQNLLSFLQQANLASPSESL